MLRRIWHSRPETARRVRQRIKSVMDWAVAMEYRGDNPCERIGPVLGPQQSVVEHMRALPHGEVAEAIRKMWGSGATQPVKLAFEFLVLTAARSGEVRGARWDEIDLSARVWTIPVRRMKSKREHRIPLCGRAMEILEAARKLGDGRCPLVFPSRGGKPISITRLPRLLSNLKVDAVPHGFKSSFRDWAAEETEHPREVGFLGCPVTEAGAESMRYGFDLQVVKHPRHPRDADRLAALAGKHQRAAPSPSPRAASRISIARPESGTRCSRFDFMRLAGIIQTLAGRSVSSHLAPRTSPDRAAVSTRNSNASLTAGVAPEPHILPIAPATSPCGTARMCSTTLCCWPRTGPSRPQGLSPRYSMATAQSITALSPGNEGQPPGWSARASCTVGRGCHPKGRSVAKDPRTGTCSS